MPIFQKFLICLIIFIIPCMNLSVKSMDEEEEVLNKLRTVQKCQDRGFNKQYCKVANTYGSRPLCDYHDKETIDNLNNRLEKVRKQKEAARLQALDNQKKEAELKKNQRPNPIISPQDANINSQDTITPPRVHQQNRLQQDMNTNQTLGRGTPVPLNHPQPAGRAGQIHQQNQTRNDHLRRVLGFEPGNHEEKGIFYGQDEEYSDDEDNPHHND